ncbi:fasciculation and elongation protein zeta-2 [Pangasianodon hypophthalmus]|uniref:fasciculation and elongation protein zeta-2 n=1 Tax=Pangasianodon hypophthalmus TaxID=310915 RepID=UPI0023081C8D|nr:fasciculation and elongation protein zeta-2 [Pangasianodon hypophthalmus]
MAALSAQCDEDWQDFNEFTAATEDTPEPESSEPGEPGPEREFSALCSGVESSVAGERSSVAGERSSVAGERSSVAGAESSWSTAEDLLQDFQQKLSLCFTDNCTDTDNMSDIKPITEENLLREDEIWNALTDNFGNVMPVDWKTSYIRSLHLPSLNLVQQANVDSVNLDLSDDEELREQMDLHSIIVSCVNEEPLFTAEQVISEIEEMMQESPDADPEQCVSPPDLSILSQELHTLTHSSSTSSYEERLRGMSVCELEALLDEVEKKIRVFSEELIDQLALRDELDFEKEVKNTFISLLIDVQNKQKEVMKRRRKGRSTAGTPKGERTHAPGTYLTTVIPYEKRSGAPSVEDLQILTKILHAMRDDSDKVPSLLTDYILKVLCPT